MKPKWSSCLSKKNINLENGIDRGETRSIFEGGEGGKGEVDHFVCPKMHVKIEK